MFTDSDAVPTPYQGEKTQKLEAMSAMFCTHCGESDSVCNQLFCKFDK